MKRITPDVLESLSETQVIEKIDFITSQVEEILAFLGEICQKIEDSLLKTESNSDDTKAKNFVHFFNFDFVQKSEIYDNFIELAVLFIQIFKFILKTNSDSTANSQNTKEAKYLLQAKTVFRLIEKLSILVASPRVYLLTLSLFVDENKSFLEKYEIISETPRIFSQE